MLCKLCNYNFRPLEYGLIKTCIEQKYCTNCPKRVGCKTRYNFYSSNDLEFEFKLQSIEIFLMLKLKFPEDSTLEAEENLRLKRKQEMALYPFFSYT